MINTLEIWDLVNHNLTFLSSLVWNVHLSCQIKYQRKQFNSNYSLLEKAMATHFSTLAWKIPWAEEPGRLQSMGSWRVGHVWATSLSLFTFMHWRRKWQPTPVFLLGESQGRRSLVGCLWGRTESYTTEATYQQQQRNIAEPNQARTEKSSQNGEAFIMCILS